jgi:CHAD domain-containing protein/uncharacterized protein Yka (UPF0111/DUF47 family)
MKGAPAEKWVDGTTPEDQTRDAAVSALRSRLGAVIHWLHQAACNAEQDVEDVHQLRVWSRRATAALRLYGELLPRRRAAWTRKQLKRVRRAANDARDCDVLAGRLAKHSDRGRRRWLEAVREDRAKAQNAVVAVYKRLSHDDRFVRRIDKLLERTQAKGADAALRRFGDWAHDRLRTLLERFFASAPADDASEEALHRFRIHGKELRYALELLRGAFPPEEHARLYETVESIQDRLGEVNDLATATARLREKIEAAQDARTAAPWRRLLVEERNQLDHATLAFREWCNSDMLRQLRKGFEALLSGRPAAADSSSDPVEADPPESNGATARAGAPKSRIVAELGEQGLLLPALANEALAANDRAKYLMTLLQAARAHANQPGQAAADLKPERLAAGVEDADLDAVVGGSRKEGPDDFVIPGVRRINDRLVREVGRMLAPLRQAEGPPGRNGHGTAAYAARLKDLVAEAPPLEGDRIPGAYIDRIAAGRGSGRDSLHVLIMDMHKELNQLQQRLATETIDGACVYGVDDGDRPLIRAFMAGVNRTRPLKFAHPGLGTTATRSGGRLVIQNDIGMTDAHVLVIHVEGVRATLTYTDVHLERLLFFQGLFDRFAVRWQDTVSKRAEGLSEALYHLCLGTYEAQNGDDLLAYLTHLGSRLVFLIDWNRARKRLRKFAARRVCLEVLRWAADQDVGHMGFLTLGGEQLVFDALQAAGKVPLPPGGQLCDLLGRERTGEFLKFTLQTASEGLRAGRSEFLIRDQISAELRHYIDTIHQGLLGAAAEHASLVVELATAARDALPALGPGGDRDLIRRLVRQARKWEHLADELVSRARAVRDRDGDSSPIFDLLSAADDIADGLEEAVFQMSLLADAAPAEGSAALQELADLAVRGAQEYLKAVENARRLHRASPREEVADFLEAVDRTITVEHESDDAHRQAQAAVLGFPGDFRQWHLWSGVADRLEEAADALMGSVLVLRDYILGQVLRR